MRTVQDIMAENGSLANIERFQTMQKWDYKRKVEHAQEMAEAFYYWAKENGKGVHLSVGGLDSITLHYFLEHIGLPVTCVSCSSLEGKGVQQVHKQIAAEMETEYKNWMGEGEAPSFVFLKPLKSKVQVLQEFGWPVISKKKPVRSCCCKTRQSKTPPYAMQSSPARPANMAAGRKTAE